VDLDVERAKLWSASRELSRGYLRAKKITKALYRARDFVFVILAYEIINLRSRIGQEFDQELNEKERGRARKREGNKRIGGNEYK